MKNKITYLFVLVFNFLMMAQTSAQVLLSPKIARTTLDSVTLQNPRPAFEKLFKENSGNIFLKNLLDTTPKAKLLSSNLKFDIYNLPIDNMPCLVPNKMFKGNMNTMEHIFNKQKEQDLTNKIPNPFKRENLIPRENWNGR